MIRRLLAVVRPAEPLPGYVCPDCVLTITTSWPGEAELLAAAHDQVMHNGRVTALVGVAA